MTTKAQRLENFPELTEISTDSLWEVTHRALCEQRWGEALSLLDELGSRKDVRDYLSSATDYGMTGSRWPVIQRKIDRVAYRVEHRD